MANAHRELGNLLFRGMGQVREGVRALEVADELEPFWAMSKGQLLWAYFAEDDLVKAARTLREYQELRPTQEARMRGLMKMAFQESEVTGGAQAALDRDDYPLAFWLTLFLGAEGRDREVSSIMEQVPEYFPNGLVGLFGRDYRAAARHLARSYDNRSFFRGTPTIFASRLDDDIQTLLGCALLFVLPCTSLLAS